MILSPVGLAQACIIEGDILKIGLTNGKSGVSTTFRENLIAPDENSTLYSELSVTSETL